MIQLIDNRPSHTYVDCERINHVDCVCISVLPHLRQYQTHHSAEGKLPIRRCTWVGQLGKEDCLMRSSGSNCCVNSPQKVWSCSSKTTLRGSPLCFQLKTFDGILVARPNADRSQADRSSLWTYVSLGIYPAMWGSCLSILFIESHKSRQNRMKQLRACFHSSSFMVTVRSTKTEHLPFLWRRCLLFVYHGDKFNS